MNPNQARDILKKVRQIEIRTNRLVTDALAGQYQSVFKGRGMNFEEVREYSPGDEVRTIDWNVTARTGKTFVKKFTEERVDDIVNGRCKRFRRVWVDEPEQKRIVRGIGECFSFLGHS